MDHSNQTHQTHKPKTSDLLASAKVVAGAAKASVSHDTTKIDKGKVAGAAADLLGAASHYGKLEEKSFGKYVEKAENYLHQYHSTTTTHTQSAAAAAAGAPPAGGSHGGGGKYGDYIKMAEGIVKHKKDDGGHDAAAGDHSDGGKYGDYVKLAEGFLKKH